ncbi:heavy metal-binding protein HIP-like [Dreissena polymorpha]|uniref:C1q domain-containing protein n=1 Tax=Dreissena polymorpha TaxID=45954 RepID=A0A9D4DAW1_DREPO|nr:heavy metal-binding protein HIP-like [Dreissena polymorpha]KAH3741720.1 hypothetical protein DPMN_048445 [Dreissena polymorpha]
MDSSIFLLILALFGLAHANARDIEAILKRLEILEQNEILLRNELAARDDIIENLKDELASMKSDVRSLKSDMKDLQLAVDLGRSVNESIHEKLHLCEEDVRKRLVMSDVEAVGFHAVVNTQELTHLTFGQPIIFETVFTNVGGAYHNNHGLFIAPVRGLYIFSVSILCDYPPHNHIETALVVNGSRKALTHSYGADNVRDQGSITIVVQLNAADEVWVELGWPNDAYLFGNMWTSFTGAIITRVE